MDYKELNQNLSFGAERVSPDSATVMQMTRVTFRFIFIISLVL